MLAAQAARMAAMNQSSEQVSSDSLPVERNRATDQDLTRELSGTDYAVQRMSETDRLLRSFIDSDQQDKREVAEADRQLAQAQQKLDREPTREVRRFS